MVQAHIDELVQQLKQIIASGISNQEFNDADPEQVARAIFSATIRFHHPAHALEWSEPDIDVDFAQVWRLLLSGLLVDS